MAPTANPAPARKGVQVHATISAEKFDALEEWRWTQKLNMVDLVKLAIDEFAANHEIPDYQGTADKAEAGKEAKPAA